MSSEGDVEGGRSDNSTSANPTLTSTAAKFLVHDSGLTSPVQVGERQPALETENLRIMIEVNESINMDLNMKIKKSFAELDVVFSDLKTKLSQRDSAIRHLEELVLLLQKSMDLHLGTSDQGPKQENGNTALREGEVAQEVIDHLQNQLAEQSKNISVSLKDEKEKREMISQLQKQLTESNEVITNLNKALARQLLAAIQEKASSLTRNEEHEDKINKLKMLIQELQSRVEVLPNIDNEDKVNELYEIIQAMQEKLQDKNNTNFALVRSVKMQSETIACLRSQINRLRDQKIESHSPK
jgi:hypothetical protein